ncbi:hypothetical protein FIBSPDRAFT_875090 [Athelia psychrophila]|uniref:Uncharacterized protein n=1 Tax=Athelia psychrophila TaxID=1759441 RepID=A0A165WR84_9AGAM|nr:hypothetical protein FIBSPDRAFT_875090 [Fibularhizoctonia sp. CBS 109695]
MHPASWGLLEVFLAHYLGVANIMKVTKGIYGAYFLSFVSQYHSFFCSILYTTCLLAASLWFVS